MDNSIRTAAIASLVKNCDKTSLNEAFKAMFGVANVRLQPLPEDGHFCAESSYLYYPRNPPPQAQQ